MAIVGLKPVQNWLGFILNPVKLFFGFTKEIPIEKVTEDVGIVSWGFLFEEGGENAVLAYKMIGSEIVGLTVIALAIVAMVVGSILFPDRDKPLSDKE